MDQFGRVSLLPLIRSDPQRLFQVGPNVSCPFIRNQVGAGAETAGRAPAAIRDVEHHGVAEPVSSLGPIQSPRSLHFLYCQGGCPHTVS